MNTKNYAAILSLLGACLVTGPSTSQEVYLMDMVIRDGIPELSNPRNISENEGYDNQPSFYDESSVLFAASRNGQTDIRLYTIADGTRVWITDTAKGSEYSPLKIPGKDELSAIRLDEGGLQLLYKYDMASGRSEVLLKDLKVGYQTWFTKDILVTTVLVENRMDLVVSDLKAATNQTVQKNVGRSLHPIPGTEKVSFISKTDSIPEVWSLEPLTGKTEKIISMPGEGEDICWLPQRIAITAVGNELFKLDPGKDASWQLFKTFTDKDIHKITRLATNPSATRLAMVGEVSAELLVQQQLEAINNRNMESFLDRYSDKIQFIQYPDKVVFEGKESMRSYYQPIFDSVPDLQCKIKTLISMGTKVISEEFCLANGVNGREVTIYEVENGKISKVIFVQ